MGSTSDPSGVGFRAAQSPQGLVGVGCLFMLLPFWAFSEPPRTCFGDASGFGDLYYGVDEEQGFCGPARGCAKYWALCKGCRAATYGRSGGEPLIRGFVMESEV